MEYIPNKEQEAAWAKATARHNATLSLTLTPDEYILETINRRANDYVRDFDSAALNEPEIARLAQKLARADKAKIAEIEAALDAAQSADVERI